MGLWLYYIDHPTYIVLPYEGSPEGIYLGPPPTKYVPPPWYANLWPETLIAGVVLLLILLLRLKPSPL